MSLSGIRYLSRQGLHNLVQNRLMTLASVGVLTACLVITGVAALLSMLNSCASGVSVVNIDNGFGAGFLAHRINTMPGLEQKTEK